MEFLIVTGLSGAGKASALHTLEDIGFYCVDNIPIELIPPFYDLCMRSSDKSMQKVAIVIDVRGEMPFENVFDVLDKLKENNKKYKVLFIDARDDVLIRRFRETRRKHPLLENFNGSMINAVKFERSILKQVRNRADYLVDTSFLSVSQLKERITNLFLENSSSSLIITCMSFGFKYGIPTESDLVFDVLRNLTGLDEAVDRYVRKWNETKEFINRLLPLIDYSLPLYRNEGKSQLVISIGCTGGKHRSVTMVQFLYDHLLKKGFHVGVNHRDITKR